MNNNQLVNDLIWAIRSPPMMVMPEQPCHWYNDDFYNDLFDTSSDWFSELARDPDKIQAIIEEEKDKRLGNYFETLWASWIDASSRFELIERNLQIFENGKTLGELDFIVADRENNKILHWELAVKFYLGIGQTQHHKNWYGPAKKDRLDLKINHLLNHQTVLCQQDVTKKLLESKNIKVDGSAVILKGRLFYPSDNVNHQSPQFANNGHCRSRWIKLSDLKNSFYSGEMFYPLIGEGWMAGVDPAKLERALILEDIISRMNNGEYRLPMLLSVVIKKVESERVFVVQSDWDKA